MAAAWPDVFVHDSNLKVNMWSLRRALGDTQKQPTYIATVAGRGYRFVADVQIGERRPRRPGVARASPRRWAALPPQRDIVGREREIADLLAELRRHDACHHRRRGRGRQDDRRRRRGASLRSGCPDGVCFLDLSTFDDPTLLPAALAAALGLRGNPGDTLSAVIDHLRQRRMLVLLDNCEHVLPAAAIFARGLAAEGGNAKLLATSRAPLGTPAEHVVRLGPLAFGEPAMSSPSHGRACGFPALDLFARRASEWAGYQLVDGDCAAVAQICRSLDGLPLAIELAAAQVEHRTPQELLAMLDEHLSFHQQRAADVRRRARRHCWRRSTGASGCCRRTRPTILRLVSVFADAFELEDVVADRGRGRPDCRRCHRRPGRTGRQIPSGCRR